MISPVIRLAEDSEAPVIKALLESVNLIPGGLDFSRVYPCWIVAEIKGEIVGCIQVLVGLPIGHINFLAIRKDKQNLGISICLLHAAERALANSGCDSLQTVSDHEQILSKAGRLGLTAFGPPVTWFFKRLLQVRKDENLSAHSH